MTERLKLYNRLWPDTRYLGETKNPRSRNVPTEEQARANETRRRIEDVREGLRLEREAFGEVWDDSERGVGLETPQRAAERAQR